MHIAVTNCLKKYKDKVFPIIQALANAGATAYLVGGCVRDMVLNLPLKDLDIEVHGIDLALLQKILGQFGHVEEVGKKFGVLLLLGMDVDWSLPRTDSSGRKPQVILQPQLDIKAALKRRDVTMNAMAINLTVLLEQGLQEITEKEVIDPFGGLADIASQQIRAVDDSFFVQDPLRMLRVMQFVGRFSMVPTRELDLLCSRMPLYDEYDDRPLARERIQAEVSKLLLQAHDPSRGFAWIVKIGRAEQLFPFLSSRYAAKALQLMHELAQKLPCSYPSRRDVVAPQDERDCTCVLHAEVVKEADCAEFQCFAYPNERAQRIVDLKESCSCDLKEQLEDVMAYRVSVAEEQPFVPAHPEEHRRCVSKDRSEQINSFDRKILFLAAACWPYVQQNKDKSLRDVLVNVTASHDEIAAIDAVIALQKRCFEIKDDENGLVECKKIAAQIGKKTSLRVLSYLFWCLHQPSMLSIEQTILYRLAHRAGVLDAAELPLLQGRDLLGLIPAGPELGRVVAKAYQLQLEHGITTKQELLNLLEIDSI